MRPPFKKDATYTRMQVPGHPGTFFRDQVLDLGERKLSLFSASAVDVLSTPAADLPYWCVAWPAGLGLARYLSRRYMAGTSVLELGSGIGVSGLGAALAGADVVLTDNIPAALRLAAMNARRNKLSVRCVAADWRAWPLQACFDLVIGSDVTYEAAAFPAFLDVLTRTLAPGGTVLLTDPGRLTSTAFQQAATEAGWWWQSDPLPREGTQAVFLYTLRRL